MWGVVGAVSGNWPFAIGAALASTGVSYLRAIDETWGSWLIASAVILVIALIPLTLNPSVGGAYLSGERIDQQGYRCGRLIQTLNEDEVARWKSDGRELTPSDPYYLAHRCTDELNGMQPEAWWGLTAALGAYVLARRQRRGARPFRRRELDDESAERT